ncbi:hypothetical protein [Sphingobacterium sp. JUb78]|uniref:hypothetical protein n=2 Tax=Sphingobacterium TaxID=28453 RepID=UPI0010DB717B|nr:hypothetical protein [Sphingobacterium sp. JUb78]TCR11836.1 hypothetical protein EDF67_103249 [Sphingobacterium sp. JUb78]
MMTMEELNKLNVSALNKAEEIEITGGDDLTRGFFYYLGRFFHAQQRDLDGSIGGPTANHG